MYENEVQKQKTQMVYNKMLIRCQSQMNFCIQKKMKSLSEECWKHSNCGISNYIYNVLDNISCTYFYFISLLF